MISNLPSRTDRAVFIGWTGSGKTTLAERLLSVHLSYGSHIVVFDAKGTLNWPGYKRYGKLSELVKGSERAMIYRPVAKELNDEDFHEAFFKFVYLRRNCIAYVDEVFAVTDRNEIPPSYLACLTRGRELGIGVWSSTQRPRQIPIVVMSEAEHWFVFNLRMKEDRKRIEESGGLSVEAQEKLRRFEFWYVNALGESRRQKLKL